MSSKAYPTKSYKRPYKSYYRKPAAKPVYKKSGSRAYQKKSYQKSRYLAPVLSSVGGALGGYLGGPAGVAAGSAFGANLGEQIRSMTGFGDYAIKKNSLLKPGNPPSVMNGALPGGSIVISHKEYLGDVVSSASANTFSLRSYDINPGDENTFPWLSQIAGNFQQYRIMGMAFQFRTMSCDALNSINTALGQVILATNYDAQQSVFGSKPEMENCEYSQSVKPSQSCLHLIECDTRTMPIDILYIRTDEIPSGTDRRMYDMGKFQIATNGFQGTSVNCGELWVTYQVQLLKPKLNDALGEDTAYYIAWNNAGIAAGTPLGGLAYWQTPFGANVNTDQVEIVSDKKIVFSASSVPRFWKIDIIWAGSLTASLGAPSPTNLVNGSLPSDYMSPVSATNTNEVQVPNFSASADSNRLYTTFGFLTTGNGLESSFELTTSGTLPASCTWIQVQIVNLPLDAATAAA